MIKVFWSLTQELTETTLEKFEVRTVQQENVLLLPSFEVDGTIGGVKIVTYTPPPPVDIIDGEDPAESTPLPTEGKITTRTIPR